MTRDELRAKINDKTPDEVIAVLGKPDTTDSFGKDISTWVYHDIVTDPTTGKVDPITHIEMNYGKAKY